MVLRVWTGAENLAPTGIRSPDHPVRMQSLYRLGYPVHKQTFRQEILVLQADSIGKECSMLVPTGE